VIDRRFDAAGETSRFPRPLRKCQNRDASAILSPQRAHARTKGHMAKPGPAPIFNRHLADAILERLSGCESLRSICQTPGIPTVSRSCAR
jgi:hypothetical protein